MIRDIEHLRAELQAPVAALATPAPGPDFSGLTSFGDNGAKALMQAGKWAEARPAFLAQGLPPDACFSAAFAAHQNCRMSSRHSALAMYWSYRHRASSLRLNSWIRSLS